MKYEIKSDDSPLMYEYDDNRKLIIFLNGDLVKDTIQESKIKCFCNLICNGILKVVKFFIHQK